MEPKTHLGMTALLQNLGITLPENLRVPHLARAANHYLKTKLEREPNAQEVEELLGLVKNGAVTREDLESSRPLSRLWDHLGATRSPSVGTTIIMEDSAKLAAEQAAIPTLATAPFASPALELPQRFTLKLPTLSAALDVDRHGVMKRRTLADIGREVPGVKIPEFRRSGPKGNKPQALLRGTTKVQELMTEEIATVADAARAVKATTVAELLGNPSIAIDDKMRQSLQNFPELTIADLDGLLSQFGPPSNRLAKPQPVDLHSFKTRLRTGKK